MAQLTQLSEGIDLFKSWQECRAAEKGLSEFIRQAWPVIEPGTDYLHNWHIDAICDYLQAVDAGQVTRLLINIPPRYMKSICVSVMWPVWSWINRPESRWLFASHSGNLSTQHSVDRRTIIQSDWYQARWADKFQLTTDQNVKTEYQNDKQGRMFATSFDGTATGKGGDRLVFDDPHDPKGAESVVKREGTLTTFARKLSTRLNDKKKGAIVVVMQRVHEKDVSALCIEQGYTHLCLPAEDEPGKVISCPSGKAYTRDASGLLWPEREGAKEIQQAKNQLGSYGYAGQYQQRPSPAGGGLFKSEWYCYYRRVDDCYKLSNGSQEWTVPVEKCERFITVDVAATEKETSDYSVIQTWDRTPSYDMILVDQWRGKVQIPSLVNIIAERGRMYDVEQICVERNGVGIAAIQSLVAKGFAIRSLKAIADKVVRSQAAQIRMELRKIFFPEGAPFLFDLQSELENFPVGHDDQVDALSHAAMLVNKLGGAPTTEADAKAAEQKDQRIADAEETAQHPGSAIPREAVRTASDDDEEIRKWLAGEGN